MNMLNRKWHNRSAGEECAEVKLMEEDRWFFTKT
jgi:hypothetical protein